MFGFTKKIVQPVSNHSQWNKIFAREQARLLEGLRDHPVTIEHVGSTAIPFVPAEPILDIALGIEPSVELDALRKNLDSLGYEEGEPQGMKDSVLWVCGEQAREFHIHLMHRCSTTWNDLMLFRAALRSSESLRNEYALLKTELAGKYSEDRKTYTNGKRAFIERVIRQYSPKRPQFTREAMVTEIVSALEKGKNVLLVGRRDAGKTYFVTKTLIPFLRNTGMDVRYHKNMNEEIGDLPEDAVVIFDEFEIRDDREQLEKMHPEEKPYYTDSYLKKVHRWLRKSEHIPNRRIFILSRNEEDIGNIMKTTSFEFASDVVVIEVPAWKAE